MNPLRATVMVLIMGMGAISAPARTWAESGSALPPARPLDLEIGLRGGVAHATGAWSDYLKRPYPVTLEANLGLHPNVTVGAFFRWARGSVGPALEEICDDCSDRVLQTGLAARSRFVAGPLRPWLGGGVGYQWFSSGTARTPASNSPDAPLRSVFVKGHGLALLAQMGVDIALGSRFRIGPYLGWSTAWHDLYLSETVQTSRPLPSGRSSLWEAGLGATWQVF